MSPPAAHYSQNPAASRPRSRSPGGDQAVKRTRRDELPGFVTLGPLGASPETPIKLFELHLRTAIPHFVLALPYKVQMDDSYALSVRVQVASTTMARSLVEAWAGHSVVGYRVIKMFAVAAAAGRALAENEFKSVQSGSHDRDLRAQGSGPRNSMGSYNGHRSSSSYG
ncbi:hypothetical protein B0H13DRAFT_1850965 [Mycena leptocephala]|nr:hypothetical protein B0H13DRAFT_1850965 [Mycena leptocephala]